MLYAALEQALIARVAKEVEDESGVDLEQLINPSKVTLALIKVQLLQLLLNSTLQTQHRCTAEMLPLPAVGWCSDVDNSASVTMMDEVTTINFLELASVC